MNSLYVIIYFTCFALIAGGAFAMMWKNIDLAWRKPAVYKPQHPETPAPGEQVMYVDLKREQLEQLINKQNDA